MTEEVKEYTKEIEDLFLQFLISEPELFVRCKGILRKEYFEDKINKRVVDFLIDYSKDYNAIPSLEQIYAMTTKKVTKVTDIGERHMDWFLKEFELFCRHKALEIEILKSMDLLKEKRYGEVESNIKKAVQIGLIKDLGTDYFGDPKDRLETMKQRASMISTGWKTIDLALYGGVERGTLTLFAGQSGSGKSLFLQNWALNHVMLGLNVVYITLELSEALSALRLDAMISGYGTRQVVKNVDDVELRIKTFVKKYGGTLQIKQLPTSGTTVNDIHAYIKEYEIQTGIKVDTVVVDYLDLLHPMTVRVSAESLFVKDKYVSEELRSLAIDLNVDAVSASQLNRTSFEDVDYDHSHISGGISKINTADNVLAIFMTPTMKENGRYQIQFLKTRTSAGVGKKIDLKFSPISLRITDLDPNDEPTGGPSMANDVINKLKKKGSITPPKNDEQKETGDVLKEASRLRDILKSQNR